MAAGAPLLLDSSLAAPLAALSRSMQSALAAHAVFGRAVGVPAALAAASDQLEAWLTAACALAVNTHALRASFTIAGSDSVSHVREEVYGLGLYRTGSLFNHSCVPNAVVAASGSRLRVVAAADIRAGEEVTISYGPTVLRTPHAAVRGATLRSTYGFACTCAACTAAPAELPTAAAISTNPAAALARADTALATLASAYTRRNAAAADAAVRALLAPERDGGVSKAYSRAAAERMDAMARLHAAAREWYAAAAAVECAIALLQSAHPAGAAPDPALGCEFHKAAILAATQE